MAGRRDPEIRVPGGGRECYASLTSVAVDRRDGRRVGAAGRPQIAHPESRGEIGEEGKKKRVKFRTRVSICGKNRERTLLPELGRGWETRDGNVFLEKRGLHRSRAASYVPTKSLDQRLFAVSLLAGYSAVGLRPIYFKIYQLCSTNNIHSSH